MKFLANVNLPKSYYMRLPYFHAVGAGEVVFMDDHSKWHALELTCSKTPTVKLLGENQGKFDFNKCGRGFATGMYLLSHYFENRFSSYSVYLYHTVLSENNFLSLIVLFFKDV